ncbi:MAG: hypothetical protein HQK52_12060 [Oligoflexia bacterium]|nr:hypothetical protein [Oligoflexia bacterium]
MKVVPLLLLFIALTLSSAGKIAMAAVEIAAGLVSPYSGRLVPAAVLGYSKPNFSVMGFSSGVKNKYYYQSSYGLAVFKMWSSGELFAAKVSSGIGFGGLYSKRGLQDLGSENMDTKHDYLGGPAFKVQMTYFDFLFFGINAVLGLRNIYRHLTLNFQDVVIFSVGIKI